MKTAKEQFEEIIYDIFSKHWEDGGYNIDKIQSELVELFESRLSSPKLREEEIKYIFNSAREMGLHNTLLYESLGCFKEENPALFAEPTGNDWDKMVARYLKHDKWGNLKTIDNIFTWLKEQPEFQKGGSK